MPFQKLQFRPGVNRETTSYTNEGGWFSADKVRFRMGMPEKIGGWTKTSRAYFLGTCRALHPWVALDGSRYISVGTHLKYYINEGGDYNDVTPIRLTTSAGVVTFAAAATTLSAAIDDEVETIPLTSSTAFSSKGGTIQINSETITFAGKSGSDLIGCVRGANGTTAAAHGSGDAVGAATVIVTSAAHEALQNDFVTFSGATSLGGNATADILNQEYQITEILTANTYTVDLRTESSISSITTSGGLDPTFVFANSSDTANGGSSVVGAYQVNTGLDTTLLGTGWGASTWGRSTWGSGVSLAVSGQTLRIWSHDNFGEDLLFNIRDNDIFYWDKSGGLSSRGVSLSTLSGANTTPTIAKKIIISDRDRHIIAFGCDSQTNPGVQDPLLIRFSDQESLTDWAAEATNTAGDLRLGSGSEIITAIETKQQIIVFTDVSLHAMQFVGQPFTFGINLISENITIAGPLCAIAVDDLVYWMGSEEFYVYGGSVQPLPCTVRDYVFGDINKTQLEKVTAAANTAFSEVWWFYPSENSTECDRYVVFNYQQQIWYYGTMPRTAWVDRGVESNPIAASTDHALYFHETGFDDGSTEPASPIVAHIESSAIDLGEGDGFMFISRLIPDLTFRNSEISDPQATMTLKMKNLPGDNFENTSASDVVKTASVPVEQFTDQVHVRLRGRSMAFRIDSDLEGVSWRLGSPRIDIRSDGRR
jgi:hypothetical protein